MVIYPPGLGCWKLDSAIHLINLYPVDNAISFPIIVIYPVDSAIQRLKNQGQLDTLGVPET